MADHMPPNTSEVFSGHPDAGGLCVFMMEGTEEEVAEELSTHTWPSTPLVEADFSWGIIPDDLTEDDPFQPMAASQDGPSSWGLDRIDTENGLDNEYNPTRTGLGAHVYIVDTGIRTTHSDFGGRAIPTLECLGNGPVPCSPSDTSCALDREGHGTHCAATVAGTMYGVAKQATLHSVKVLADNGSGSFSWMIEAIDWIMTNGQVPAIISASLGGRATIRTVTSAIDNAVAAGITVVVAAGNQGRTRFPNACMYTPAQVPSAITVGSTTSSDSRSSFSNVGSCLDIFAPGSSIVSADAGSDSAERTLSGTSMACPHVSGVIALLRGDGSGLSHSQALSSLKGMASSGKISGLGNGSPDKFLYMGSLVAVTTTAPPGGGREPDRGTPPL
eukprot:CAMPEP_0172894282 /NCGR_PEP_ID=MMETSP1075-20121228/150549_1 /TAXON_ID=2916 /ORGANISM="Ceratium fusus, Strain PA161109" /LENGTH=387 /DNA_ID=CAMNT_0013749275 /DNA_START=47 /DNA_END=1207 /DNA_ORIENTATION=+